MEDASRSLSRRKFMRMASGSLAFSVFAGTVSSVQAARPDIPIGVQLYCVRRELEGDMPGVLASLAEMGYQGVEFADYFQRPAKELRRMLDDHGLRCCGTHIFLDDMVGEKLEQTVAFNQELGNQYLVVRWLPEERRSAREKFLETIDTFNEVAENLSVYGMRVGYHNHDYIFQEFDGETLWNMLADRGDPRVFLQLDTGNASTVGVDVVDLLTRNKGRSITVHVKPYSKKNPNAFIGEDELDWTRIIDICESTGGTEWYIIEYEQEGVPPLEALKVNQECFKSIRA